MANPMNSSEEILVDILNLPEEVLIEILLKLPVKSLVRFRCVCKSWSALLKSPHFIDMHLKISLARNDGNVLIQRVIPGPSSRIDGVYKSLISIHSDDRSLSVLVPKLEVQIEGWNSMNLYLIGSSNGLVCAFRDFSGDIILFNPTISEFRTLPPSPQPCPEHSSWWTRAIGFSFDPASNDYKVIRVMWTVPNLYVKDPSFQSRGSVEVYNLSNDTWRELEFVPPQILSAFPVTKRGFNLFFNGRIHWYACNKDYNGYTYSSDDYDSDYNDDDVVHREWILSWNFSSEVFEELQFPITEEAEEAFFNSLVVIQEHLALIFLTCNSSDPQSINIWIMKEYGIAESWSKQYYIKVPESPRLIHPVTVWKNERLIIEGVGEDGNGDSQVVTCDINSEQWEYFDIYGLTNAFIVVFYKETLVSVART